MAPSHQRFSFFTLNVCSVQKKAGVRCLWDLLVSQETCDSLSPGWPFRWPSRLLRSLSRPQNQSLRTGWC